MNWLREGLCTRLLTQLMMSCDAAEDTHEVPDPHAHPKPNRNLSLGMPEAPPIPHPTHPHPQALFWQMQLEVLQGQLTIAKEELERPPPDTRRPTDPDTAARPIGHHNGAICHDLAPSGSLVHAPW